MFDYKQAQSAPPGTTNFFNITINAATDLQNTDCSREESKCEDTSGPLLVNMESRLAAFFEDENVHQIRVNDYLSAVRTFEESKKWNDRQAKTH